MILCITDCEFFRRLQKVIQPFGSQTILHQEISCFYLQTIKTRMHSSRMRTGRSLTVSQSLLRGVSAPRGVVSAPGGCLLPGEACSAGCLSQGVSAPRRWCLLWGVSALGGGVCPWGSVCSGEGVSAPGRVSVPGGVSAPGGLVSQHALR